VNSALAENQVTIWWVTIGLGAVVVVVVILLLSLLVSIVRDIDRNVTGVWSTATMVARNTTTSWLLGNTADLSDVLRGETKTHAELFRSKGGER